MKLFFKRFTLLVMFFMLAVGVIACGETTTEAPETTQGTTTEAVETTVNPLDVVPAMIIIDGSDQITGNFTLPSEVQGVTITYVSSVPAVAEISANPDTEGQYLVTVNAPSLLDGGENTTVTITGTMTYNGTTETFQKVIRVMAVNMRFVDNIAELYQVASLGDMTELTGIVFYTFDGGYFMYDETGAIGIYDSLEGVQIGDEITLTAEVANYYTMYQLTNVASHTVNSSGNAITWVPEVIGDAACIPAMDSSDKLLHGQLFTVSGMLVEEQRGNYENLFLLDYDGEDIGQIYHYSDPDSLAALDAFVGKLITLDVLYYTDHGDIIYLAFLGGASDVEELDTNQEIAEYYAAALSIDSEYVKNTSATLPDEVAGMDVEWAPATGETNVTFAANVATFGDVSADTAAQIEATVSVDVDGAGTMVDVVRTFDITILNMTEAQLLALDKDALVAPSGAMLEEIALPELGEYGTEISWAVTSGPAMLDGADLVFDYSAANEDVVLTATLTKGAATDTKEFTVTPTALTITDISVVKATADGESAVMGNVYLTQKNGFFMEDATGKIFIYTSSTPSVSVGDEVVVYGLYNMYSGLAQLKNPVVSSVLSVDNDVTQTVNAYTATPEKGLTYEVTGTLVYSALDGNSYSTLHFVDASDAIVAKLYYKSDGDSYDLLKALVGEEVTVNLVSYNDYEYVVQLHNGIADVTPVTTTDQELADAIVRFAEVLMPEMITEDTDLELPTSLYGATLAWSSDDTAAITNEGVVTTTEGVQTTVTLTLDVTVNAATATTDIEIQVGELPVTDIADVYALVDDDMVKIQGVLTDGTGNQEFTIQDATGGLAIYEVYYLENADDVKAFIMGNIGNEVELIGYKDSYNGLVQIADIQSYTLIDDQATMPAYVNVDSEADLLPFQGQLVEMTGMLVVSVSGTNTLNDIYVNLERVSDGLELTIKLSKYASVSTANEDALLAFEVGDIVDVDAALWWNNGAYVMYSDYTVVTASAVTMTDAEKLAFDVALFEDLTVSLADDYDLPELLFSTVTVVIDGTLTGAVDDIATTNSIIITRQASDETGNFTFTLTVGAETPQDVVVAVTIEAALAAFDNVETFTNLSISGSSYADGSFLGDNGVTWTYTESRGDFDLDGQAIMLDKQSDPESLTSSLISGGVSAIYVEYYDAYSGAAEVEIYVNDILVGTSPAFDDDNANPGSFATYELTGLTVEGDFVIRIQSGDSQMVIDNLSWNGYVAP